MPMKQLIGNTQKAYLMAKYSTILRKNAPKPENIMTVIL
jgi:hypothetical protein